jgi:hypothetical protein
LTEKKRLCVVELDFDFLPCQYYCFILMILLLPVIFMSNICSHSSEPQQEFYASSIVSRFKLHLRSKVGAGRSVPPLPLNKTVVEVFGDFLIYLLECASSYIMDLAVDRDKLRNCYLTHLCFGLFFCYRWSSWTWRRLG